jgi:hypothetical protein
MHTQSVKGIHTKRSVTSYGYGNINPFSIGYSFQIYLRISTNPTRINLALETLDFRRGCISHPFSLLMSAFSLLIPPANLAVHLHRPTESSATAPLSSSTVKPASSVYDFSPVTFSAQKNLIFRLVSCYAIFKGWLLLSLPSSCHGFSTSFHT